MLWELMIWAASLLFLYRFLRSFLAEFDKTQQEWENYKPGTSKRFAKQKDPWNILGISKGASATQVKEAYYSRLKEYHPDKVAHLGPELQNLAKLKTTEIVKAYEALSAEILSD